MAKKSILFLFIVLSTAIDSTAQLPREEYYPEGTKWTEIRYDTNKYSSWFSVEKSGDGLIYVPNYEQRDFYVANSYYYLNRGKTRSGQKHDVYCVKEDEDSLAYHIIEYMKCGEITLCDVAVDPCYVTMRDGEEHTHTISDGVSVYHFDWEVGQELYFYTIIEHMIPQYAWSDYIYYSYPWGTIHSISEGNFGGEKPLKYVDLESGKRIIQGIGVTEIDYFDCLFGAAQTHMYDESHYRSMLVHFERNGEVLYDVWPSPEGITNEVKYVLAPKPENDTPILFDLSGRRLEQKPSKGIYIKGQKKVLFK